MKAISRGVGGEQASSTEDLSTSALDRLLWIFLRLLVSQQGLEPVSQLHQHRRNYRPSGRSQNETRRLLSG
jgi:hypothetical protein